MRVVVLADEFPPETAGGSGMIAHAFARGILQCGHEVIVLTVTSDRTHVGESVEGGMRVVRLFSRYHPRWRSWLSVWHPSVTREVRRILAQVRPDIVHAHNVHQHLSYASLRIARRYAPVILTMHDAVALSQQKLRPRTTGGIGVPDYYDSWWDELRTERLRFNPFRRWAVRRAIRACSRVLAVSHALAEVLTRAGFQGIEVFYNGIDTNAWEADEDSVRAFRARLGLRTRPIVLFGGRLSGMKGCFQALSYMSAIQSRVPDAVLVVMGRVDAVANAMKHEAEKAGIGDRVVCTGWVSGEERRAVFAASTVIITPSLYLDPFPTINLEAMAAAKPVVTTVFGGSPEAVEDGVTGYVGNPYDTQSFSDRIAAVLLDQTVAHMMGVRGRERVRERFDIQRRARALEQVYTAVVSGANGL